MEEVIYWLGAKTVITCCMLCVRNVRTSGSKPLQAYFSIWAPLCQVSWLLTLHASKEAKTCLQHPDEEIYSTHWTFLCYLTRVQVEGVKVYIVLLSWHLTSSKKRPNTNKYVRFASTHFKKSTSAQPSLNYTHFTFFCHELKSFLDLLSDFFGVCLLLTNVKVINAN